MRIPSVPAALVAVAAFLPAPAPGLVHATASLHWSAE